MNAPLYLKLQNSHTINITKAHPPKTMRQRNPADNILPPSGRKGMHCVCHHGEKREQPFFEVGDAFCCHSASIQSRREGCAEAEHLGLFIHKQECFQAALLCRQQSVTQKSLLSPQVRLGGPVLLSRLNH